MSQPPLTHDDLVRFVRYLNICLSHHDSLPHQEEIGPRAECNALCARVISQLERGVNAGGEGLSEADFVFMESWSKARELIVAGMQVLEMADPGSAEAVSHERECTETAFDLLPRLIAQARRSAV